MKTNAFERAFLTPVCQMTIADFGIFLIVCIFAMAILVLLVRGAASFGD